MNIEKAVALAAAKCGLTAVRIENEDRMRVELHSLRGSWFFDWNPPEACRRLFPPGETRWPGPPIQWSGTTRKELALMEILEREFRMLLGET